MAQTRTEPQLRTVPWAGDGDPADLLNPSLDSAAFYDALAQGRFILRRCGECSLFRYPHAPVCPYCGSDEWEWREAASTGTALSWGRNHLDFVPEFKPLLPYVVLCVQLDAGPRMFGRLLDRELEPHSGMSVEAVAERWPSGVCVPAFAAMQPGLARKAEGDRERTGTDG